MEMESNKSDSNDIEKSARNLSDFLNFSTYRELKSKEVDINSRIEAVLTRLDEFYGMLDMIRSDMNVMVDELLPEVRAEMDRMQLVFSQIDDLERFVEIVKSDHAKVEKFLKETENEHGSLSSIKKAISGISLSSLFNKQERKQDSNKATELVPPSIYSTSHYLSKEKDTDDC